MDRPAGHHGRFTVGVIQASLPAVGDPAAYASIPETAPAAPVPAPADSAAAAFPAQTPELLQPFQGVWDAYQSDSRAWTIEIEDGRFRGVLGPDDWYEGTIRVRRDTDPMQIDFDIEDCRCSYRGMTSQAIFRVTGETILLAAPQPGLARPTVFSEHDGRTVELRRTKTTRPGDTPRGSTAGGVGSTEESRTRTR